MINIHQDLFCNLCNLPFGTKFVFNLHLKFVHRHNVKVFVLNGTIIKNEPEIVQKLVHLNLEHKFQTEFNRMIQKDTNLEYFESEMKIKQKWEKIVQSEEPNIFFDSKDALTLNKNENNPLECKIEPLNSANSFQNDRISKEKEPIQEPLKLESITIKEELNKKDFDFVDVLTVHEEKKSFKCDTCNTNFTSQSGMNIHAMLIHDGNKEPLECKNFDA